MNTPDGHVDIQIDDPKKLLDVCSLLDRPDFILDVFALRKKWRITKSYPRIKNKLWQELPPFKEQVPKEKEFTKKYLELERSIQFMKDMFVLKDTADEDISHKERTMSKFKQNKSWRRFPDLYFRYDVMELRKKYRKPPNFDQIIICATLYATVLADDYKTCGMGLNYAGESLWQVFHEPQPIISFYPLVTLNDIIVLFQKEGEKALQEYQNIYLKGKVFDHDTISNVARDRQWYWWHKQGLSYGQILKKAIDVGERLTRDAVIKAIGRYTKLLAVDI